MQLPKRACAALAILLLACCVQAVDRSKFRTCKDTAFCKRLQYVNAALPHSALIKFWCAQERRIVRCARLRARCKICFRFGLPRKRNCHWPAVQDSSALLTGDLRNGRHPLQVINLNNVLFSLHNLTQNDPGQDPLELKVQVLRYGVVRMSVREKRPKHPRYEVKDVLQVRFCSFLLFVLLCFCV